MRADRFEQQRGSWVLARAGHSRSAKRRGERLLAAARRRGRYAVGAGDAGFSEATTRGIVHRSIFREEGAANTLGWFIFTMGWLALTAVSIGPGLLIGCAAYGLWWAMVSKWGPLKTWPYVGTAFGLMVVMPAAAGAAGYAEHFSVWYLTAQFVIGLFWAAYLVRANGWPAVADAAKKPGTSTGKRTVKVQRQEPAPQAPATSDGGVQETLSDSPEKPIGRVVTIRRQDPVEPLGLAEADRGDRPAHTPSVVDREGED